MLLLIDIGNTNTTIGIYYNNKIIKDPVRHETIRESMNIEEYSSLLKGFVFKQKIGKPSGAAISSVVPELTPLLVNAVKKSFGIEPINVNHKINTGLSFSIKNIEGLGADRITNAVAAHQLYKGNLIVVDFGTATTFCVITEEGEYKGGAIMPGLGLSVKSLTEKTAKLPRIKLKIPERALGLDTTENILSGVVLGHAGAVERIISEIKKEINRDLTVIATGGFFELVAPYIKVIDHVNSLLTLEGLRLIYEINSK